MEAPKRKIIRLQDYDYSQDVAYFITVCTRDRRCLFGEIVGDAHPGVPKAKLSELGHTVKTHIENIGVFYKGVTVQKYVVMPNHIHVLLLVSHERDARCASPTKSVVAKVINALKSLTTRQFGKPIWQRSYHDHIIRNEDEYQLIWQYINENPGKWADDKYFRQVTPPQ